jgi:nitroreductase
MPDVIEAIAGRRASRAIDARPVPPAVLDGLALAFSLAPSHGNSQPGRLVFATGDGARGRVFAALSRGNREWAGLAPVLAVVAANPAHDSLQKNSDGTERELWAFHAGLAAGNLLTQATAMGLVAHPMAGFDELAVRDAAAIPSDVRVLAVVAIGYPGDPSALPAELRERESAPRRRLPLDVVAATDRWEPRQATSWKQYRDQPPS